MALIDPIHWKWLIPEIAYFPLKRQRKKVWDWEFNYGTALVRWMPTCTFLMATMLFTAIKLNIVSIVPFPFIYLPILAISHFAYMLIWRRAIRSKLRKTLRAIARCEECGYKLMEGTSLLKCTECGHEQAAPETPFEWDRYFLSE